MEKPDQKKGDVEKKRRYPTVSAKLPTGQLVEMVFRRVNGETAFVLGASGETVELGKVPASGGGWLVPYSPRNNLLTHRVLLLPSSADEYDSEALLRALVQGFIRSYVDVSPDFEEVATQYVLLSWLYDDFPELPYLRVQGDYGSGKSRFLQTVGSLVYKPIFASGASTTSPLFRLLDSVRGTLILDESDFRFSDEKAEIVKILNNGNARGFPVLRSEVTPKGEYNPRAFDVFGPKVIATRGPFDDRALESRCITEMMGGHRVRADIPKSLPDSFHEEALSLRNKLLLFRFRHADRGNDLAAVSLPGVEPRVVQIFAPLLATADEKTRRKLVAVTRAHDRRLRGFRTSTVEAEVLAVLLDLLSNCRGPIGMKAIARGYSDAHGVQVSPRWIGSVVRRKLGLEPALRRGRYVLLEKDRPRVLELAEQYGVAVGDDGDVGDVARGG